MKIDSEWLCQLTASLAWLSSVFVYGSYGFGDCLQLLAASAWTVANLINLFKRKKLAILENKEV